MTVELDTFAEAIQAVQVRRLMRRGAEMLNLAAALSGPCQIRTYSGMLVDLFDPDPATLLIEDVAHHLSLVNRFTGATCREYSVAEHCLLGRAECDIPSRLPFLVHDAPEAWLGDVAKPLKKLLAPLYEPLEARIWERFAGKYGIPLALPHEVHLVDKRMLATEQRDLQGREPRESDTYQPYGWHIDPHFKPHPKAMEASFLKSFELEMQRPERWRDVPATN